MATVGSCSSLVALELLRDQSYAMEESAATLLVSAILLDTGNLKVAAKVTETDVSAVEELTKLLPSSFDREEHFDKLLKARFDISKLTVQQALLKDYKQCTVSGHTIGFSSVTALLTDFLSADTVNAELMEFQSSHRLDAFLVLGISMSDPTTVRRQIAVFQPEGVHSELSASLVSMLETEESLRLESIPGHGFEGRLLEQGNTDLSRKHVMPLVTSFVSSM
jgi:inorganic pyrophosphatase/exopolyphosphatase